MKIKFTNLFGLVSNKNEILKKIIKLIKSSNFVGGNEVLKFEDNFKKFVGSKYCVTLGNGTDALEIAIKSLALKKNSEIIVPVNTWISTAEAVVNNGYKVIFCDINLSDYSLCLKDLKKRITKKTSAIIPVHLYGNPSNIDEVKKQIKGKNIKIIEDCAQAHGAKLGRSHVGTLGDVGTFSFFPGKNLGAFGDGGALITNSKKIYEYAARARGHGALKKYDHKFPGRNSRLDTIQAAVLNVKIRDYKKVIITRNKLANIYFDKLKDIKNINLFKLNKKNTHAFHQFVLRTNKRDQLMAFLLKNNIQTMIHYPYMLNELKFFKNFNNLKNSNKLGKKIISLPISEEHTKKEIMFVSSKISEFFSKHK
jgi:dTDP-4-amino-4,6-dideoxygalactose transaminase